MTLGRAGEAMDEQPGKRQRDGQQYPASQPAREKYPHGEVPSSGPRSRLCRVHIPVRSAGGWDRSAYRAGSCLPDTFRCSRPRYPQCGVVITTSMRPIAAQGHCCVMSSRAASKHHPGCSAGQMVMARSSKAMRSRWRSGTLVAMSVWPRRRFCANACPAASSRADRCPSGPASAGAGRSAARDLSRSDCSRTALRYAAPRGPARRGPTGRQGHGRRRSRPGLMLCPG